jgi:hypothetical protein
MSSGWFVTRCLSGALRVRRIRAPVLLVAVAAADLLLSLRIAS